MKWVAVIAMTGALAASNTQPQSLVLELQTRKSEQLVGEPADLRLVVTNRGAQPVVFSESLLFVKPITLTAGDAPITCSPASEGLRGAAGATWITLKPGESWNVGIPGFRCLCQGKNEPGCNDWLTTPGTYRIQIGLAHHPNEAAGSHSSAPPAGAWDGQLSSAPVQVRVLAPEGVDAQAWTWAKDHNQSPFSTECVGQFPSSRYAAMAWYPHINVDGADPEKVRSLIGQGRFLATIPVPDPSSPDGWTSLAGRDLARWRIEHAERILREHADFPYAGQLRLAIGVNNIALGKKDTGKTTLRDLAAHSETNVGEWARKYLTVEGS